MALYLFQVERGRLHGISVSIASVHAGYPARRQDIDEMTRLSSTSDPVVPGVNYFYIHKGNGGGNKSQTERAAELVRAIEIYRGWVEK